MKHVACIMLLVLGTAGLAHAGLGPATPRMGHWEVTLQTRYIGSKDLTGEHGSKLSLNDDLGWGFGCSYHYSEKVNLGFSFAWRTVDYTATLGDPSGVLGATRYSNWLETSMVGVNGEWIVTESRISPYLSGALGWAFIDTNIYAGSGSGCWWDPWYGYICSDNIPTTFGTDAAAWGLGAGLRLELAPAVFARVGYDHAWIDIDTGGSTDMLRVDLGALY